MPETDSQKAAPSASPTYPGRAAVAVLLAVSFFGIMSSGLIKCPFNSLFHFPCPACGSNRAGHALLNFDVHEALRNNPIAPLAIGILVLLFARVTFLEYRDGSLAKLGEGRVGEWIMRWLVRSAWLLLAVWILRAFGLFGGLPDQ